MFIIFVIYLFEEVIYCIFPLPDLSVISDVSVRKLISSTDSGTDDVIHHVDVVSGV